MQKISEIRQQLNKTEEAHFENDFLESALYAVFEDAGNVAAGKIKEKILATAHLEEKECLRLIKNEVEFQYEQTKRNLALEKELFEKNNNNEQKLDLFFLLIKEREESLVLQLKNKVEFIIEQNGNNTQSIKDILLELNCLLKEEAKNNQ